MATLTISAAARLCHCDRRTLQRAIHAGRLHLDAQHGLSREELIATGYLLPDTPQPLSQGTPQEVPQYTPQEVPQYTPQEVPQGTPQAAPQAAPQPVPQALPYDPRKFVLGKLCLRRHEFCNTGMSLLRLPSRNCPTCVNIHKRQRRAARYMGPPRRQGISDDANIHHDH
jgi:hypothetical protein